MIVDFSYEINTATQAPQYHPTLQAGVPSHIV